MKQEVKIGQTDYTTLVLIRDTAGAPKTGLTNASAGIDVCYTRVETDNDVVLTAGAPVALATPALTDVHLDWGFLQVDATNAPGLYRLDLPDGVFASGAWSAVVSLIATGIDPCQIEFILTPSSPYVGVQLDPAQAATTFASLSVTGQLDAGNVLIDGATVLTGNVSMADGLTIPAPSTADRAGITITGNGTGAGIKATGGGTNANGMTLIGGATNGVGLYGQGSGTGAGIRGDGGGTGPGYYAAAGVNAHGMELYGNGIGSGLSVYGGTTGNGFYAQGGATSGDGIYALAPADGSGLDVVGADTGHGIKAESGAGATGNGINANANSTNGHGIYATGIGGGSGLHAYGGLTGNGMECAGGGTSGDGIYAKAAGTGHGLACHGGGVAGDGINALADNDGDGIDATGATNGHGMILTGVGTGEGFSATGGATGAGMLLAGGGNNADADGLRTVAGGALALDIDSTVIDTLLTRLSATRATYLDYLFSIYFGLVSGVAQATAGGAATITLAAGASAVNDFYKGQTVSIYTGTGAGQARAISAYNGGTKVATVTPAWATAPDNTSWYVIMNVGSAVVEDWIDGGRLDLLLDAILLDTGTTLDALIQDIPTVAEFNARSLVSADYTVVGDLGVVQTADHTAAIADIPTVAEFNARSIVSADYTVVGDLGVVQTADHTAAIADIPTVAEFNARSIVSADYTVVGDLGTVQTADHTASIAAIKAITDLLPSGIKKNTALANFEFYMVLAADHISPALLKVVDCQRSIDGAAFANCNAPVATEVSAGIYKLDLAASDLNGDVVTLKFSEATCDTRLITIKTST